MNSLPAPMLQLPVTTGWPNQERAFSILLSYIKEQKLVMAGSPLIFFPVDLTIAAEKDEFAFTIQVPVKPL